MKTGTLRISHTSSSHGLIGETALRGLPGLADWTTRLDGSPHQNAIKLKRETIWTGGLPHLNGLPHLPGAPHLYVNRP